MKIYLFERSAIKATVLFVILVAGNLADGFRPLRTCRQLNLADFRVKEENMNNRIDSTIRPTITAIAVTTPSKATLEKESYHTDLKITAGWVAAALAFAGVISYTKGTDSAIAFCAGYLLEQCLSVDNLIVFLVLFDYFKIDKALQPKVLNYGIIGAIILRGIFIGLGAVAISKFKEVVIVFAAVLFFSSYKILAGGDDDEEEDLSENAVVKFAKKYMRTTEEMDGDNFFKIDEGVRFATPLLLCLVCVEVSDIIFAFDSVPAIFGVTADPFIVFTSNIFAIAGLRSLFGVLSQAVQDLKYLEKAVGIVLAIIAAKLTASSVGIELLSPVESLLAVIGTLGIGILASVYDPFVNEPAEKTEKN